MFIRFFAATAILSVSALSMEPYSGDLDTDRKIERINIVNHINKHANAIKGTADNIKKVGLEDGINLRATSDHQSHREAIKGLSEMVEVEEEAVQQREFEAVLRRQNEKIAKDIKDLERDVHSARSYPAPDGTWETPKMIMKLSRKTGEPMDRDIHTKLKEMELALNVMENEKRLEDERIEQFKTKVEEVEKMLNDMMLGIEKINGKKNLQELRHSEYKGLVDDNRDFREITSDMNRKVFGGEE